MSVGDNDLTARLVEQRLAKLNELVQFDDGGALFGHFREALSIADSLLPRLQAAEKVAEAAEKVFTRFGGRQDMPGRTVVHTEDFDALREALAAWKASG